MRIINEQEFSQAIRKLLDKEDSSGVGSVTGPGRSGAIASVYASHILGVPFVPFGQNIPVHLGRLLIIDTAWQSGATLRKASRRYQECFPLVLSVYEEPPRVAFWYESQALHAIRQDTQAA